MADHTGIPEMANGPAIEQPVAAIAIPSLSIVAEVLQKIAEVLQKIADDLPLVLPTGGTP